MKLNSLLMLGFYPEESVKVDGYLTITHSPFKIDVGGLSPREYKLLCKSILNNVKLIIINLNKKNVSLDESFILFSAYTNDVSIIGVGHKEEQPFLEAFLTNKFKFMEDALPHIRKNY